MVCIGMLIYFAHPYRSTDKPHIEHANALIRQYLLKYSSFTRAWRRRRLRSVESQ